MGIYDRDYERDYSYNDAGAGPSLGGPRTLTTNLVFVMFGVYVVQLFTQPDQPAFPGDGGWFTNLFMLDADLPVQPWKFFQLLSYGFLHDVHDIRHIAFNMFGFWMFGRWVEQRYGRAEYLKFFLAAIAFAGLCWVVAEFVANGAITNNTLLGASGGVTAIVILFAFCFPKVPVLLFFVLPMPAWVMAVMFVGFDLLGQIGLRGETNIAFTAHLGGAAFAAIYFQSGVQLGRWFPSGDWLKRLRPGPKLRVHHPDEDEEVENNTERQVDEILAKIQAHGQESLTRRERKILEQASRKYQQRRK